MRTRPRVTFISEASMGATTVRQIAEPGLVASTFPPSHQLRLRFHRGRAGKSTRGIPLTVSVDIRHLHAESCMRVVIGQNQGPNCRSRRVAPRYGLGVTSTLGGRGDGSGCIDLRMIENATAPTATTPITAAARTSGLGRRLGLRASAIT